MPGGAQKRSNSSSYPSTDNPNAHTLSTPSDHAIWSGGQAERAPWFNLKIHEVENDYTLSQLCETGTVPIASRGVVAVFSPSHAAEHAAGAARGTTRRPNTRAREDLTKFRTATGPMSPGHGGYPTPTQGTAPSTTTKPVSMLQAQIGELADGYKIAPETIEQVDFELCKHFTDAMENKRMREQWVKRCEKSGRKFIVLFAAEMSKDGISLTAEETVTSRMRAILAGGLSEATLSGFLTVISAYEEWNEVLEVPLSEAARAHAYKKLITNLSTDLKMQLQLRISILESKAAAMGENPAKDDPIGLVTQAAGVVLEDEQNEQAIKAIEEGRAFFVNGRFDPDRNKRNGGGGAPGGQTWGADYSGPEKHIDGMRDCHFCKDRQISAADKQHLDLKCSFASKEQKDALKKERSDKRDAKQAAWKERSGKSGKAKKAGKNGSTNLWRARRQRSTTPTPRRPTASSTRTSPCS